MLLVVFGAGASYDSVLQLPPPLPDYIRATNAKRIAYYGMHEQFRPSLANMRASDRR